MALHLDFLMGRSLNFRGYLMQQQFHACKSVGSPHLGLSDTKRRAFLRRVDEASSLASLVPVRSSACSF